MRICRGRTLIMTTSPKFCIYGAGAIGTIATLLAQAGAAVHVIARGETLATLKREGLRLIIDGEMLQADVQVSADPAEPGPQDYVIIAVKAPSLAEVAARIGPLLGPETAVVTAMNGVPWWFFAGTAGPLADERLTAVDTVSAEDVIAIARTLRDFKTSMLQDAEHGRPVEIDALLTATRDIGQMVGVPTPFIDSVLGLARLRAISLGLLDRAA